MLTLRDTMRDTMRDTCETPRMHIEIFITSHIYNFLINKISNQGGTITIPYNQGGTITIGYNQGGTITIRYCIRIKILLYDGLQK